MSEVLDFGTSYEEAQGALSALTSAIMDQAAQVQDRSSTLDSLQQSLEKSKDQARQGLEQLGGDLGSANDDVQGLRGEFESAAEGLQNAADQGASTVGDLEQSVDGAKEDISQEVEETRDQAEQL